MSILIRGMEMPQNCDKCRFQSAFKLYCDAMPYNFCGNTDDIERPDWCPLIELPPHGRLIDADAIQDYNVETFGQRLLIIDTAPTVIEVEGETE